MRRKIGDEIENDDLRFTGTHTEAPSKLLHEDSSAVRRSQEYQHVNVGHIDALVEKIDGGHEIQLSRPKSGHEHVAFTCLRFR